MKWLDFLNTISDEPVCKSSLILAGPISREDARRQLSRWVRAGKVIRLRSGVYTLAAPFRKAEPHPFLVANTLKEASYVSMQSGLAHHGLIPEFVPLVTSVTTGRPERVDNKLGSFVFKHVKTSFFYGFRRVAVDTNQNVFLASPEKSLLDLIYLTPRADSVDYLRELRLQHLEVLDWNKMTSLARAASSPKLMRAVKRVRMLFADARHEER